MKRKLILIILLLLPVAIWAQYQQFRGKRVENIQIVLTRTTAEFNPQSIKAQMKTKEGDVFSQIDFDEDLKQLSKEFDRVEPEVNVRGNDVTINLTLTPKPVIGKIIFEGNDALNNSKLLKELEVEPGTIFDRYTFNQSFHKLRALYIKKGYFEAELSYNVVPVEGTNTVNIVVNINEGRSGRIKKLQFEGFSKKEERDLLDEIMSKKFFFLTSWMSGAGTYQPEMSEQDRYVVLNYLHNQGYADAKVDLQIIELKRGIALRFVADRGPQYKFGKITFAGNTFFTDEEVEKMIQAKDGESYSPEKLQKSVEGITDLYGSKGYIEAVVNYEPRLVTGERVYDVHFVISQGEQYRVGLVRVFGAQRTQPRVILHECYLTPGEIFDTRRLKQTEMTLQNIGYFKCVNVYAVRAAAETEIGPRYRDVYIEVEEDSTGNVGLSLQASSDASFSLSLDLVERNFNYKGLTRIFSDGLGALRGGGEYLQFKAQWGLKVSSYSIGWTKPYFMDSCWIVGFNVLRSIDESKAAAYTLIKNQWMFHATYPLNPYWRAGWQYRITQNVTRPDNKYIDRQKEKKEIRTSVKDQQKKDGVISAVGFNLGYDTTDWTHTRGLQSVFVTEMMGFLGDYHFISFAYANVYYHSLWKCGTLKLRGDARFFQPLWGEKPNNLPIGERIFLGGEHTVRGYRYDSLGPKITGSDNPQGGISSMLLSAEVMHEFHPIVSGFVFVDGGYVSARRWNVRHFQWSVGVGVRLCLTNNVPILLGLGYPINPDKENKDDVQHFFFSLGGRF